LLIGLFVLGSSEKSPVPKMCQNCAIRTRLKDSVLLEGIHYIRPFGGRKLLFIWEAIEADLKKVMLPGTAIPLAKGGVCHG
jgi:hypothetical protein